MAPPLKNPKNPSVAAGACGVCGQREALSKRLVGNGTLSIRRGKSISPMGLRLGAVTFFSASGFKY
jgi:hypothetical protein